jgi:hypothetical protein
MGKERTRRFMPWLLAAGVALLAVRAPTPVGAGEDVEGGRLSRACRVGLWLVTHGQREAGLAVMWFGC